MRRAFVAIAVLAALGLAVGLMVWADHAASLKEEADRFAQAFEIRHRPSQLDEGWIEAFLAKLPGFGESTIEALVEQAPYTRLSELEALTKETANGPRRLLSDKQLLLIAIFFDLEP